jgi:hypothetical protein
MQISTRSFPSSIVLSGRPGLGQKFSGGLNVRLPACASAPHLKVMHQRTAAALIGQWARIFGSSAVSFAGLFDASELIQSGTPPPFFARFFSCVKYRL